MHVSRSGVCRWGRSVLVSPRSWAKHRRTTANAITPLSRSCRRASARYGHGHPGSSSTAERRGPDRKRLTRELAIEQDRRSATVARPVLFGHGSQRLEDVHHRARPRRSARLLPRCTRPRSPPGRREQRLSLGHPRSARPSDRCRVVPTSRRSIARRGRRTPGVGDTGFDAGSDLQ